MGSNAHLFHGRRRLRRFIVREIGVDDVRALMDDIHAHGILEPILISADGWIISGHAAL
jgi:ParB-like chromosome segregation protein Spo0J